MVFSSQAERHCPAEGARIYASLPPADKLPVAPAHTPSNPAGSLVPHTLGRAEPLGVRRCGAGFCDEGVAMYCGCAWNRAALLAQVTGVPRAQNGPGGANEVLTRH